jgi:hypothetical protein
MSSFPKVNGQLPDRGPDYPTRADMAKDAAILEKSGTKSEIFNSKCYIGGPVAL